MARNTAETDSERTLGTIVKELTEDITTLFRGEIALLKLEVKDTVAKLGGGIGLFAGAVFVGLFGLAFLLRQRRRVEREMPRRCAACASVRRISV